MINTLRLTHLIYLIYLGWVGLHVSVYNDHLQAHLRIVFLAPLNLSKLNKLDVLDLKCLSFNIELQHIGMSSIKIKLVI